MTDDRRSRRVTKSLVFFVVSNAHVEQTNQRSDELMGMMSGTSNHAEILSADITNHTTSARGSTLYDDDDELAVEASIPSSPTTRPGEGLGEYNSTRGKDVLEGGLSPAVGAHGAEGEVKPDIDMDGNLGEGLADERQCRICFSGAEEGPTMGKLISPCLCSGSMRYVHVNCINTWRGKGTNAKAFMECPQCHHHYMLRRTLVSGLASSQPLLFALSSLLFTIFTLLAGSILHFTLVHSSKTRRSILSAKTMFDIMDGDDDNSSYFLINGGGTIIYDIFIGAIQTFTGLALTFADKLNDASQGLPGPLAEVIFHVGVRFILGIGVLGSLSFASLLMSISLFGPLQMLNGMRGLGFFGNIGRRRVARGGENGGGAVGQLMVIMMVIIGTANTLRSVYGLVNSLVQRLLIYVEAQILEVNPDEVRKAKEEERSRDTWPKRWMREQRWKTRRGWYELVVRCLAAARGKARIAWENVKARLNHDVVELD